MSEPAFGPACPGCTPDIITAKIERAASFGLDMTLCRRCRDNGALHHAFTFKNNNQDERDEEKRLRRKSGEPHGEAHGQG
jgi:hypothetical protein